MKTSTTTDHQGEALEQLYAPAEAGQILGGYSPGTLANWRSQGRGPAFVRVNGRSIRYTGSALKAYVAQLETVEAVAA